MVAECLQYLHVYHLKDAVQMATRDWAFIGYKRFQFVTKLVNSEELWDTLLAIIQACYPIYRILHLKDMRVGSIDKICYFVRPSDRLLKNSMENAMERLHHPLMSTIDLNKCNLSKHKLEFLKGELNFDYYCSLSFFVLTFLIHMTFFPEFASKTPNRRTRQMTN